MVNCFCPSFYPVWCTVRKVIFLKQCEFYSCTCERLQHSIGFGLRRNVTGFAVTWVVTYSETDSVKFNDASAGVPNLGYTYQWGYIYWTAATYQLLDMKTKSTFLALKIYCSFCPEKSGGPRSMRPPPGSATYGRSTLSDL